MPLRTRLNILFVALVLGASYFGYTVTRSANPSPTRGIDVSAYLVAPFEPPEDYVLGKFARHDVVFLGEQHHVKQNLEFVGRLIAKLYEAGIDRMAWEFSDSDDQVLTDRLLGSPSWDEKLAERILWRCCGLAWVSTGYRDILHAAWSLNRTLSPADPHFRIIALNTYKRDAGWQRHWAEVIDREVIAQHRKALIYCGSVHAWTRFELSQNGLLVQAGNLIYREIGDRAVTLVLHGGTHAEPMFQDNLEEFVERLMARVGGGHQRAGFDIGGRRLATVPYEFRSTMINLLRFVTGTSRGQALRAGDVWDGYIYLAPISEWKSDEFIGDFIDSENLSAMKSNWEQSSRRSPKATTREELIAVIQDQIDGH